jgi:hypothetical protein
MGIFDLFKRNKNIENENGLNEIYYDQPFQIGRTVIFFNKGTGPLKSRFHKKNPTGRKGWINGLHESWYKNGQLQSVKHYDMGDVRDKSQFWDEHGKDITKIIEEKETLAWKRKQKRDYEYYRQQFRPKPKFPEILPLPELKSTKKTLSTQSRNVNELTGDQKMLAVMYKTLKGIDYRGVRFDATGNTPQEFLASDIDGSWYYSQSQIVMIFKAFSDETFNDALQNLLNSNKIKLEDETSMPGGIRLWHGDGFQIENPPQINGANMIMITNTELKVKHE